MKLLNYFLRPVVKHSSRMLANKHLAELASLYADGVLDRLEYYMLKMKVQTETRCGKEMP